MPGGHLPAVKWPEVNLTTCISLEIAKPWNACVRGLRYRPLHVEMKN
jgi:hypothetical protein